MILIGTDEGIYRFFEDCGWPIFHCFQDRAVVGLASPSTGVLAALDRSGDILESTDHGMTWRVIPSPEGSGRPTAITVDGTPPAIIVATKPLGLYRRFIGGADAESFADRGERVRPPADPPRPWPCRRGRDAGRGQTEAGRAKCERAEARGVVAPPGSSRAQGHGRTRGPRADGLLPGWLYAAVSGAGLWRSGDVGKSWVQCKGLPSEVYAVRPVAGRAGHLWAATHDGCWLSTDAGQTWEDRSAGLENVRHVARHRGQAGCARRAPRRGRAEGPIESAAAPRGGLNFALYESTNSGKTWTQVKRNFPEVIEYDTITDVRFDPASTENVVVALGSGELWSTRNGGAYWGPLARQIRAARVLCAVK